MTRDSAPTMRPKLSFRLTFREAFTQVFGQFGSFARVVALPLGMSLGISVIIYLVGIFDPESQSRFPKTFKEVRNQTFYFDLLPLFVLGLFPFAIFGVAWCQRILPGQAMELAERPLIGRRSLTWFAYVVMFMFIAVLPIQAFLFLVMALAFFSDPLPMLLLVAQIPFQIVMPWSFWSSWPWGAIQITLLALNPTSPYAAWIWSGIFVLLYFVSRFSLAFPGLSVAHRMGRPEDRRLGLAGSWRLTRRNSLKLFFVLMAIGAILLAVRVAARFLFELPMRGFYKITGIVPNESNELNILIIGAFVHVIDYAVVYICIAVVCAALCSAYAQLRGWDRQAPEPSETKNPDAHPA